MQVGCIRNMSWLNQPPISVWVLSTNWGRIFLKGTCKEFDNLCHFIIEKWQRMKAHSFVYPQIQHIKAQTFDEPIIHLHIKFPIQMNTYIIKYMILKKPNEINKTRQINGTPTSEVIPVTWLYPAHIWCLAFIQCICFLFVARPFLTYGYSFLETTLAHHILPILLT